MERPGSHDQRPGKRNPAMRSSARVSGTQRAGGSKASKKFFR
jgi:hypothetical protein